MPDLSALSTATTTALGLSNLILVTPDDVGYQPQNISTNNGSVPQQPKTFLFDYEGEQTISLQSDITDHFIENNSAIQDQIALKPVTVTTHGYVGELNDVPPSKLKLLKQIADKLIAVEAYTPQLTQAAIIAYNQAAQLYATGSNLLNNSVALWDSLNGDSGTTTITGTTASISKNQNKQQIAFQMFYGYWTDRRLFTIQTPWAIFKDMAIMSLRAVQGEETRVVTDFEVTFKQMRFADTITTSTLTSFFDPSNFQGRAFSQGASLVNLGTANLTSGPGLGSVFGV